MFDKIAGLFGIGNGYGKALGQNNQLMQMLGGINKPYLIDQNKYQDVEFVDPEYAGDIEAILQGESAYNSINTDPTIRNAQLSALNEMQDLADRGISIQDDANQRRLINRANTEARSNREAIDQNMQARGLSGSGMSYISKLQADQDSANQMSEQAAMLAGQNADRRMNAISNLGSMSGQVRGQEFEEASAKASANDAVNNYNTNLQNQINQVNQSNQQTHNNNVAQTRNNQTTYNRDNALKIEGINAGSTANANSTLTNGLTNLAGSNANLQVGRDNAIGNFAGSLISGGAMMGGAMYTKSDRNAKKDISEFDSSKFLDELTGYKYKYKKSYSDDNGEKIGIMAQDLKKVVPNAVDNIDGVLHVDYNNPELVSAMLGAIADMNKRLKKAGA